MSLHKFAEQVAANGRGDDSLLVHMTPDEVKRLQAFAEANGRSLTINPHTGLPEAGFLSDLFKAVAPIALGAFLGPAGAAFGGGFMSAGAAGLLTGGITTLATGSLSRGLMAGLGAYGGANLGESLMGAGTNAGMSEALAGSAPSTAAQIVGDTLPAAEGSSGQAFNEFLKSNANPATMSGADKLSAGLGAITSSPEAAGTFAKDNWKSLAAAAAPIMAGAMVPTTTTMPKADTNPAYIRQKLYDPYTQTYKSLAPVKASEWGGRSFSDAYTNPQTGEMATFQPRQTSPMAAGGIVALAKGGVPGYADGGPPTALTDEQLFQKTGSWEAAAAARDAQNNALNQYNWQQQAATAQQAPQAQAAPAAQAQAVQTAAPAPVVPNADAWWASQPGGLDAMYNTINQQIAANPNMTDAQIDAAMKQYGISSQDVHNALQKGGGSMAEEYAVGAGNMGLSGLNQNINSWLAKANTDPNFKMLSAEQKQQAARDAMGTVNMNEADVIRATGKTIAQLFPKTTTVTPTGVYGTYGNNTGVAATTTPGDIGMNPDGTVTVFPNIPGRPPGGFTGMGQVVDTYTAGGGRTGYVPAAPKTMAEFNALYNKQTGDSAAAYDYLIGKGAGTADAARYPTQSVAANTATGIQRPYWSSAMKYKPRYLSYDKDGNVVSSETSPNAPKASLTAAKTINVNNPQGQVEVATLGSDGAYHAPSGGTYDVTGKALNANTIDTTQAGGGDGGSGDAAGGLLQSKYATGGYAMGGGLGSLGSYSDGGRLLKGPGDGVSDSIPATIGTKNQPARLADGEFVVPARIVSELGNGSTEAGAKKLYAMMDRVQKARGKTTGKNKVAANSRADKYLPA